MNIPFPAPPPFYAGRKKELEKLQDNNCKVAVIVGIPGSGKAALASKAAPEKQKMWIEVQKEWTALELALKVFRDLNRGQDIEALKEGGADSAVRAVLAVLEESGIFMVLNNTERLDSKSLQKLCLLGVEILNKGCMLILMNELPEIPLENIEILKLLPLHKNEVNQWIDQLSSAMEIEADEKIRSEIWSYSQGNPLLAKMAMGAWLTDGEIPEVHSNDLFTGIMEVLNDRELELISIMSAAQHPVSIDGIIEYGYAEELKTLQKRLIVDDSHLLSIHPIFYKMENISPEILRLSARILENMSDEHSAFQAFRIYASIGDWKECERITHEYSHIWIMAGLASPYLKILEEKEELSSGLKAFRIVCLDFTARYDEALELYNNIEDTSDLNDIFGNIIATLMARAGKMDRALELADKAIERELPPFIRSECLLDRAAILSDLGRTDEAREECLKSVSILEEFDDFNPEDTHAESSNKHFVQGWNRCFTEGELFALKGRASHSVAVISYNCGDLNQAENWCEKALSAFRRSGDVLGIPRLRGTRAMILARLGRLEEAASLLEENIKNLGDIADHRGMIIGLNTLSTVLAALRKPGKARAALDKARTLAGEDSWALAECDNFRGNYEYRENFMDEAIKAWREAVKGYEKIGRTRNVAMIKPKIASALLLNGSFKEARKEASEALEFGGKTSLDFVKSRAQLFIFASDFCEDIMEVKEAEKIALRLYKTGNVESAAGISLLAKLAGGKGVAWHKFNADCREDRAKIREIYGFILRVAAQKGKLFILDSYGKHPVEKDEDFSIILERHSCKYSLWIDFVSHWSYSVTEGDAGLFTKPKTAKLLQYMAEMNEAVSLKNIFSVVGNGEWDPFTSPYKLRTLISRLRKTLKPFGAEKLVVTGMEDGTYELDLTVPHSLESNESHESNKVGQSDQVSGIGTGMLIWSNK